jgi:hypothetical protein
VQIHFLGTNNSDCQIHLQGTHTLDNIFEDKPSVKIGGGKKQTRIYTFE